MRRMFTILAVITLIWAPNVSVAYEAFDNSICSINPDEDCPTAGCYEDPVLKCKACDDGEYINPSVTKCEACEPLPSIKNLDGVKQHIWTTPGSNANDCGWNLTCKPDHCWNGEQCEDIYNDNWYKTCDDPEKPITNQDYANSRISYNVFHITFDRGDGNWPTTPTGACIPSAETVVTYDGKDLTFRCNNTQSNYDTSLTVSVPTSTGQNFARFFIKTADGKETTLCAPSPSATSCTISATNATTKAAILEILKDKKELTIYAAYECKVFSVLYFEEGNTSTQLATQTCKYSACRPASESCTTGGFVYTGCPSGEYGGSFTDEGNITRDINYDIPDPSNGESVTFIVTFEDCPKGSYCTNCQKNDCAKGFTTRDTGNSRPNACGLDLANTTFKNADGSSFKFNETDGNTFKSVNDANTFWVQKNYAEPTK